jgi:nitrous oxidase accessory protein NosD
VAAAFLVTVALGAAAGAETTRCTPIARVPMTIRAPGVYCLLRNLSTRIVTGTAITIDADDVVLDLNGRVLDGSGAGPATEATGIGSLDHANLSIKNGTVRGFLSGIEIVDAGSSRGHRIEDVLADRNTMAGISASGRGLRIRGNRVLQTGGSTSPLGTRAYGIVVRAPESVVADNEIVETTAASGSFVYGIHATGSDGVLIEGNRIMNEDLPPAYSFGIIIPFSQNVLVVNNRLNHLSEGVTYSSFGTGKYRDNVTAEVTTPFTGGTDAGGNN